MGDSAQGRKNMRFMVQNLQHLLCHNDKTTLSNFMVDVYVNIITHLPWKMFENYSDFLSHYTRAVKKGLYLRIIPIFTALVKWFFKNFMMIFENSAWQRNYYVHIEMSTMEFENIVLSLWQGRCYAFWTINRIFARPGQNRPCMWLTVSKVIAYIGDAAMVFLNNCSL